MKLSGKRALITGSSRGIGAEMARLFAEQGAIVAVNYRASKEEADSVVGAITARGGKALAIKADVSRPADIVEMFSELRERLGGLDILVNNAGLSDSKIWKAEFSEITLDMWKRVFAVDSFGTFLCTQGALGLMKKGTVVNIASTPALAGDKDGIVYASAKGSVVSMTKMLARILAPRVRVNCMVFGSFETGWLDWLSRKEGASYRSAIPMGRFGKPSEAAKLALFLASDDSSFITGQTVVIDGGEFLH